MLTYQVENQDYCSWDSPSHRYFGSSKRSIIAVNILGYSVCNSLISFEAGNVPEVVSVDVNAFCISSNCRYSVLTVCTRGYMVSFLSTMQMRLYMQEYAGCFGAFSII